jgi:hypothetical protein
MSMTALLATTTTLTLQGKVLTVSHPQHSTHTSMEAIVLAIVGAIVVLACVAWALARTATFEPRWMLELRHACAEAGFRASAMWAEFSDWLRLGR